LARKSSSGEMTGREKAAILLISLGPASSAEIFKHLNDEEIEELTLEIANMRKVSPEEKEKILAEFYEICIAREYISEGGINYAKEILEKALGSQRAIDIISKLTASLQVKPFDFARKAEPAHLLNFIQNEHPQTISLILAYLPSEQSGQILSALPQAKQAEVAKRIATMDRTSPEIIREVESILEKKLSAVVSQNFAAAGGLDSIVEILSSVDRGTEKNIMDTLDFEDAELAEEIRKKMFVFEDIITLDSTSIQRFIREIDNKEMAIALKGSTDEVADIIYTNMSKRMAEMIKEDMEFMGPVRLSDVENAQQKIVNTIRALEETGEIIIARGGGDEIIVWL